MDDPTIPDVVTAAAERHGHKTAVRTLPAGKGAERSATFRELEREAEAVAAGLRRWGIRTGDHVALLSRPRPEWASAFLGILKAGAVVVPFDPMLGRTEIHRLASATDIMGVIVSGPCYPRISGLATQELTVLMDEVEASESALPGEAADVRSWSTLRDVELTELPDLEASQLAALLCTSGTMGDAKAVMLSHRNITSDVSAVFRRLEVGADDVVVSIAPWNHSFGLIVLVAALWQGATVIYTDDYANLTHITARFDATALVGVPKLYHAMHERLLQRVEGHAMVRAIRRVAPRIVGWEIKRRLTGGNLRFLVSGSAPLAPEVVQGFRDLGIGVVEGYGLTEASPVVCFSTPFNAKPGSVGPPLDNVEVDLKAPDAHGIGELLVRGPNVMQGYYRNERRSREALDEQGWLHTGDLASIDEDGWVHIKGRRKNVIVLESGKNVYPEEIEWELLHSPLIEEVLVRQAERDGTAVIQALVYPNDGELDGQLSAEAIRERVWGEIRDRNRRLAPYKRVKSAQDLLIVEEPFEKTTLNEVKRYLYQQQPETGKPQALERPANDAMEPDEETG